MNKHVALDSIHEHELDAVSDYQLDDQTTVQQKLLSLGFQFCVASEKRACLRKF